MIALASASARAVRRLNCRRRGESGASRHCAATSSTASPTYPRSLGTASAISAMRPPRPVRRTSRRSGGLEGSVRLLRGAQDGKQRVELGELEEGLEVLVEAGEAQVPPLLADLLGQRDEHAQPRGVDVAGAGEVDDELLGAAFQRVEDLLLQLLAVPDDQLPIDTDNHHPALILLDAE